MKILQFVSPGQVPSREMLLDSHRLGDAIVFDLGPDCCFGRVAFCTERMRDHSKNSEWFVDFRSSFDGPNTFMYLSTFNKKAFTVDERFQFPNNDGRVLNEDEILFLCHLTEFKSSEINERVLDCLIKSAHCSGKSFNAEFELKKLVDFFKIFKKKAPFVGYEERRETPAAAHQCLADS